MISLNELERIFSIRDITIQKKRITLRMYNKAKITSLGTTKLKCQRNDKNYWIEFVVVKENLNTIIGCETSQKCGFIKVLECDELPSNYICINNIDGKKMVQVEEEFGDVF